MGSWQKGIFFIYNRGKYAEQAWPDPLHCFPLSSILTHAGPRPALRHLKPAIQMQTSTVMLCSLGRAI